MKGHTKRHSAIPKLDDDDEAFDAMLYPEELEEDEEDGLNLFNAADFAARHEDEENAYLLREQNAFIREQNRQAREARRFAQLMLRRLTLRPHSKEDVESKA
jgi:hypothetical protein